MLRLSSIALALMVMAGPALAGGDVQISQAWIRAVPPVSPSMAAYFTLTSDAGKTLTLTGGKADFAGMAMIHAMHRDSNGQGTMSHLMSVPVAPGKPVVFRPGERHLMLMNLKSVPAAGATVTVCLTFRGHDDVCAPFQVRHNAP